MRFRSTGVWILGLCLAGVVGLWSLWTPVREIPRDVSPDPIPLPQGRPVQLLTLGTSLTARYAWPEALAAALETCLAHPVVLTRVARSGALSLWGLDQMPVVAAARPDIVLLELAINDADLRDGLGLRDSRAAHAAMITELKALPGPPQIVLMTMNPAQGLRGLLRPRLGAYYAMVVEQAVAHEIGALDLYPRWMALPRGARGLGADGLHPAPQVAEPLIVQTLVPYLAAARGRSCAPEG